MNGTQETGSTSQVGIDQLVAEVRRRAPLDAAEVLRDIPDDIVAAVLSCLKPHLSYKVLLRLPEERRNDILPLAGHLVADTWAAGQEYPENSVGRLMEPVDAVFTADTTVGAAIDKIRELVEETEVTYAYVVDDSRRLRGLIVMRDLLLSDNTVPLRDIMLGDPFYFSPHSSIDDAMKAVLYRHYPVYPACDESGVLVGVVYGYMLFEQQTFTISAQAGQMVGVDKEEHLATPWPRSFKLRHPWLQLNLITAFAAATVVSMFEDTIAQVVVLAAFLPVLAGQSGNTGCQALAVTLRGMTLGEFKAGRHWAAVRKETLLGLFNGALVGVVAACAMFFYASSSGAPNPAVLAVVVMLAMTGACLASGLTGVVVPLGLKRLGADPATASSIFLTTATDVVSMGLFLWLAHFLVL